MNGLTSLGWTIHDHLKEHRPKMFRELKRLGTLNATVLQMQTQARDHMQALENTGLYHHEAWEIVKDEVLLPTEEDVPNLGGEHTAVHGLNVFRRVLSSRLRNYVSLFPVHLRSPSSTVIFGFSAGEPQC